MNGIGRIVRKFEISCENATERSFIFRYGLATLFVGIAFMTHNLLTPILHEQLPFTFFITSSIMAAYIGRFGAGLYALVLGWFLGDYFFVPPVGEIGGYGKLETVIVLSDLGPSLLAIILIEFLHKARQRTRVEIEARKKAEASLVEIKERVENMNAVLEKRVTERTSELEQSVKFLEAFCYSIAHDLRAPLRAIQGFILALEEDYAAHLDATAHEYALRITTAARRMDKLILDLLDYGRLNHQRLEVQPVSLSHVIAEALSNLRENIREQKAQIHVLSPLPDVRADSELLELILTQLVQNALKFRRPDVPLSIEVGAKDEGDSVRIFVRDNGVGISSQHQQRIFRLFETLQPSSSTQTGVGLALVSKAVERMKGRTGVQSEPGKGSTFWIELQKAVPKHESVEERKLVSH